MELSLDQILAWQHLAVMGGAMALIQAIKTTLEKIGLKKDQSKVFHILLPWLPLLLCMGFCAIPGVIQLTIITESGPQEPQIGLRLILGVFMGGLSGQVWKIIKTKLELLQGKVG